MHGGYSMLHIEITPGQVIHVRSGRQTLYDIGENLKFDLDPERVRFFNPQTEKALQKESRNS
jgi:hypothetical protein